MCDAWSDIPQRLIQMLNIFMLGGETHKEFLKLKYAVLMATYALELLTAGIKKNKQPLPPYDVKIIDDLINRQVIAPMRPFLNVVNTVMGVKVSELKHNHRKHAVTPTNQSSPLDSIKDLRTKWMDFQAAFKHNMDSLQLKMVIIISSRVYITCVHVYACVC